MNWRDLSEVASNVITIVAIVAGGIWTYLLFVRQRQRFPRLHLALSASVVSREEFSLVRCYLTFANAGTVVVRPKSAQARLRQVFPAPSDVEAAAQSGLDPVDADRQQIEWPLLAQRNWLWTPDEFEIEPGESDTLCADFFVPLSVEVVEIYAHVSNPTKSRTGLGWQCSTLIVLHKGGGRNGEDGVEARNTPAEGREATGS